MSNTKSYNINWDTEKKIKNPKKGKRFIDKYRKAVYNLPVDSQAEYDDSFDDYLEYEVTQNKIKLR
jgi:hypothetical protein